jgi:hypothetical protein
VTDRDRLVHLSCRECGRLANPLYGGVCVPCLDLLDEIDENNADAELAAHPWYHQ